MCRQLALLGCVILASGCATSQGARSPVLTPMWTTGAFANPESAIPSARGDFL